jgi:hypothetical protein
VLASAEANKQVILRHRTELADARRLTLALLAELRRTTRDPEQLAQATRLPSSSYDCATSDVTSDADSLVKGGATRSNWRNSPCGQP